MTDELDLVKLRELTKLRFIDEYRHNEAVQTLRSLATRVLSLSEENERLKQRIAELTARSAPYDI